MEQDKLHYSKEHEWITPPDSNGVVTVEGGDASCGIIDEILGKKP